MIFMNGGKHVSMQKKIFTLHTVTLEPIFLHAKLTFREKKFIYYLSML